MERIYESFLWVINKNYLEEWQFAKYKPLFETLVSTINILDPQNFPETLLYSKYPQ